MSDLSATSRYIEIRPDNIPADGVISFKNGFPVLSFTISAQEGLLDPSTIRIVGDFNVYSDNNSQLRDILKSDLTTFQRTALYLLRMVFQFYPLPFQHKKVY